MIPYLPSAQWYADRLRLQLDPQAQALPRTTVQPNRTLILPPYGEQTLTVPVLGGRRRLADTPWTRLELSDHGNWRHAHWEAINSAYGRTPYFHYYSHLFEPAYTTRFNTLAQLSAFLHLRFCKAADLPLLTAWLLTHQRPELEPLHADTAQAARLSALHLLFLHGPATIFQLLALNSDCTP